MSKASTIAPTTRVWACRKYARKACLGFMLLALTSTFTSIAFYNNKLQATMAARYGEDGTNLLNAWMRMIEAQTQEKAETQIVAVNDFFNQRIQFGSDITLWQVKDYWATPLETMGIRAGDCEDFTIAKYVSLLQLGIPKEQLRLIYVRASITENANTRVQAHMVLGYYETPTAIPLILDNLDKQVKSAKFRPDLKPVFSFNGQGLWVGGGAQSKADPTRRLSHWRGVLQRMQEEGFE